MTSPEPEPGPPAVRQPVAPAHPAGPAAGASRLERFQPLWAAVIGAVAALIVALITVIGANRQSDNGTDNGTGTGPTTIATTLIVQPATSIPSNPLPELGRSPAAPAAALPADLSAAPDDRSASDNVVLTVSSVSAGPVANRQRTYVFTGQISLGLVGTVRAGGEYIRVVFRVLPAEKSAAGPAGGAAADAAPAEEWQVSPRATVQDDGTWQVIWTLPEPLPAGSWSAIRHTRIPDCCPADTVLRAYLGDDLVRWAGDPRSGVPTPDTSTPKVPTVRQVVPFAIRPS